MTRQNLRIDTAAMQTIWWVLLLSVSASGASLTVKSGGGGNYTTIQACATAMAAGDTCTVFAGTYNEKVSVSAGTVGNYKTLTVNGSDVVTVQGFTLGSHTKLIGNCPQSAAINTCGFNIQNTASPNSAACVSVSGATDVYIVGNVMYACGSTAMITLTNSASYVYLHGNTLSYACITQAQAGTATKECDGMLLIGNHFLVENNDLSHYTLGIDLNASYMVTRNNTCHDQYETEAGGNSHTDCWFSEPGAAPGGLVSQYNVFEGNVVRNGFGPDAKGVLSQTDSGSACAGGNCFNLIERYNVISRIGGGVNSPGNYDWPYIKVYNNTIVDAVQDTTSSGIIDNSSLMTHASKLNSVYYFASWPGSGNTVYTCGTSCNSGYNLFYCAGSCPGTLFASDPGNKSANPVFVNYTSAGSLSNDYHLQAQSPAIAAGTYLTTVGSGDSGSGTSLVLNDASYFQDGYGLSNANSVVHPDCIAVGTVSNIVCVTAVNYSTNTLTLASSITRSAGQAVYLYSKSDGVQVLTGAAPDLGAYPYTGSGGSGSGGSGSGPVPPSTVSAVAH